MLGLCEVERNPLCEHPQPGFVEHASEHERTVAPVRLDVLATDRSRGHRAHQPVRDRFEARLRRRNVAPSRKYSSAGIPGVAIQTVESASSPGTSAFPRLATA